MKRMKVLIVTYYWPPSAGGGVQRWLKLSGHLPEFGVEPIIFTPENPAFSLKDDSLEREVPQDMEIWKFPIWEPFNLFGRGKQLKQGQVLEKENKSVWDRLAIWARANLFIPDPRVFWVRPAVSFLLPMIKSNHIDAVITTGPPHSMHLIGLELQKKTGVKWVADFRDPWSEWDILNKLGVKGRAMKRHQKLEQQVIQNCDLLITVSKSWCVDFERLGAKQTFVLTNGYEPSARQEGAAEGDSKFVISHLGMLSEMRNPAALWQAIAELCVENREFAAQLEIYLAGITSKPVIDTIGAYPELKEKLVVDGYLSHQGAIGAMRRSGMQLLITNDSANARGHIPGKLFEYLEARRPILAIGDPKGDAASIIHETQAGACVAFDDVAGIKKEVSARFQDFQKRNVFAPQKIDQYSRRSLAMKLSNKLFQLILPPGGGATE